MLSIYILCVMILLLPSVEEVSGDVEKGRYKQLATWTDLNPEKT